jgi:hypothetical protein
MMEENKNRQNILFRRGKGMHILSPTTRYRGGERKKERTHIRNPAKRGTELEAEEK